MNNNNNTKEDLQKNAIHNKDNHINKDIVNINNKEDEQKNP